MRIVGAGWGRTGTTSAAAALEELGFGPCMHMQRIFERPELSATWIRRRQGEPIDWRTELAEFGSCVDWPACSAWEQIAAAFPDALVLLTMRDADAWYESALGTIHQWTGPDGQTDPPEPTSVTQSIWDEHFGGWEGFLDRERSIAAYNDHVAEVRRVCPPDRLLEWSVTDGWEPLCGRLGVPVPSIPFPHLNAREG